MASLARTQRGVSESVQWAVLWPVLLLVTLGIIQAGIYLHSRNVAQRAATVAVDSARGSFGTSDDARELAQDIARVGGLRQISVRVQRGATSVRVDVSGQAPTLVDIGVSRVHEVAAAPLERVTQP
jgi:Flp pilus assembly protein TadG